MNCKHDLRAIAGRSEMSTHPTHPRGFHLHPHRSPQSFIPSPPIPAVNSFQPHSIPTVTDISQNLINLHIIVNEASNCQISPLVMLNTSVHSRTAEVHPQHLDASIIQNPSSDRDFFQSMRYSRKIDFHFRRISATFVPIPADFPRIPHYSRR